MKEEREEYKIRKKTHSPWFDVVKGHIVIASVIDEDMARRVIRDHTGGRLPSYRDFTVE